jgi:hypothetical protein
LANPERDLLVEDARTLAIAVSAGDELRPEICSNVLTEVVRPREIRQIDSGDPNPDFSLSDQG